MKLRYDLPEAVLDAFQSQAQAGEALLYALPADIASSGVYGDGWVLVTAHRIHLYQNGSLQETWDIQSGSDYKAAGLVGNGILEGTFAGEARILARYTMTYAPQYTYIAKALDQLRNHGSTQIRSVDEPRQCPKCGRLLPEGTRVCPACIHTLAVLKKLWGVAQAQQRLLVGAVILFWFIAALQLVQPRLYRILIDRYLVPQTGELISLLSIVGLIGLTTLLMTLLTVLRGRITSISGGRLSEDLREMVYCKIQALSVGYLDQRKVGDLMNRVTGDTGHIRNFIQFQAGMGLNELILFLGVGTLLLIRDWQLALLILVPTPFAYLLCRLIWKRIRILYRAQGREWDRAESLLSDILNGIRAVKAFGQEEQAIARFRDSSQVLMTLTRRNEKAWNTLLPSLSFLLRIGGLLVLLYGGTRIVGRTMQLGELIEFSQYAGMIYGPLQFLSFFPRMLADAVNAAERIFEIMEEEPAIQDKPTAVRQSITGAVSFENVTFGYKRHEPVLEDLTIAIEPGEMVGLVGRSGAGKSTFINLVMRFYDTDQGRITIDGTDIRDIDQQDLHAQIGVVLQETFLFSGTILDNIRYSKPQASMEEIITAAKVANAHDFILRFPDAYDTKVGEKGHRLSGGERQRIAIARAILCDPKILILDEATASLDTETEQEIQEALGKLTQNRTTIAIAHRLSTLKNARRLLVIENGKGAELGTHEELIRKKGIYYQMVMAQRELSKTQGIDGG